MKQGNILIWVLPTRILHWLLTAGFMAAGLIAFLTDKESSLFPYHAVIGLALALLVVLRVIWGFGGTRHARFASFLFGPRAVLGYLKAAFAGVSPGQVGHNPGSAYAIFAMLALVLGISVTGILLARGSEGLGEAHEAMSYALVAVVVTHVLGVGYYTLRHRENITLSMVSGKKDCEPSYAIASARPIAAAVFLGLLGAWSVGLVRNYDAAAKTTTLPCSGAKLQLGENAKHEKHEKLPGRHERKHDDE